MKKFFGLLLLLPLLFVSCNLPSADQRIIPIFIGDNYSDYNSSEYGELVITFTSPVFELSDYSAMVAQIGSSLKISIDPGVEGQWRPIDQNSAAYEFTKPLPSSSRFKVKLDYTALSKASGKILSVTINGKVYTGDEYYFETPRIKVYNCYSRGEYTDSPLILVFSQPVNIGALKQSMIVAPNSSPDQHLGFEVLTVLETNIVESNNCLLYYISTNKKQFVIQTKGMVPASYYILKVPKDFYGVEGNMGTEKDFLFTFNTYFPLVHHDIMSSDYDYDKKESHYYPSSSIFISFNNELDSRVPYSNQITVDPPVKGMKFELYGDEISFSADFKAEQTYRITVGTGLKDIYGQNLVKPYEFKIATEHSPSYFKFPYGYMILENYLPQILPMKLVNIEKLEFNSVYISSMEEFLSLINSSGMLKDAEVKKKFTKKSVSVKWSWDKLYNFHFDLSAYKKSKSGILIYQAAPEIKKKSIYEGYNTKTGVVLFTDLGVTVKSSSKLTYAFVRKLKDNSAVEGAKVYAVEWTGDEDDVQTLKLIYCGKTGKNGFLQFDNPSSDPMPLVFAEYDGNFTMNYGIGYAWDPDFDEKPDYYSDEYYYGKAAFVSYDGYSSGENMNELFLFTERYLYKPGDTVEVKGIFRFRENDQWIVPDIKTQPSFNIKVVNSRDEKVTNFTVKADEWGSIHCSIKLPGNCPTGSYYFYAETPDKSGYSMSFRVEDYKPAQAEMKIIPGKTSYLWGETLETDLIGWYLFGAPVIKPIRYEIQVHPMEYSSKNYPAYSFSPLWWLDESYPDYSFTLDSKTGFPDKDGKLKISKLLENKNFKGNGVVSVMGSTILDDQSTVYNYRSDIEVYNPAQIGIDIQNYFVDQGAQAEIEVIALNEKDEVKTGVPVTIEVSRYEWKSAQAAGVNGKLEWTWKLEISNIYKQNDYIGQKTIPLKADLPGMYVARIKSFIKGHQIVSEDYYYVIGKGDYGWKIENNNELRIETDKPDYEIGDTAKLMILNPLKNADVVVTIERDEIHQIEQFKASDSIIVVPVTITEDFVPNMYVSVMLFSGRTDTNNVVDGADLGKPSYYLGYASLNVSKKKKSLKIEIKPDKEKYEPGETAKVTVSVKDSYGNPVESEVTLAAVDKGVLNLVNYSLPNPLHSFYAYRLLAIYTSEVGNFIYGLRYKGEKGEVIGGDGKDTSKQFGMIAPRFDFKATAFYSDKLITKNGSPVSVTFKIPDNLTTFKLMAVAQTKDSKFGYGDSLLTVSKPLMLLSSLPSFARMGDSFSAGVTVFNYTGEDAVVKIVSEQPAPSFVTNIKLAKNSSAEVKFGYKIPYSPGKNQLDFVITASAGNYTDGIHLVLPVKTPKLTETMAIYKTTDLSAEEKIKISENVLPQFSRIIFNLSPSAFSELKGSVDYMIEYPYGCLEQKCSKMLPLILGEDVIVAQKLLDFKTKDELRKTVQDFINNDVPKYLTKNGFKYWPDSYSDADPYLTVYTAFVLSMARQKGYLVTGDVMKEAERFVKEIADGKYSFGNSGWTYSEHYKILVKAFAFYTARLNGYENVSLLKQVYLKAKSEFRDDISVCAYLLKAASLYKEFDGKAQMIAELTESLMKNIKADQSTAYFNDPSEWGWFYYSSVISTSVTLQALLESKVKFDIAHKVIRWLVLSRNGDHWSTTHENAMVFWAFNTYLGIYEKSSPNFKASAEMNGKSILETVFKSANDPVFVKEAPLTAGAPSELILKLKKSGTGLLYYYIKYQYMLKKYPDQVNAGFTVLKKYYDYDTGAEVKDNTFIRGKRYIVEIKVITPKERYFAVLDDSLPAGFEAVHLDFATEANEKNIQEGGQDNWWGGFSYQEKYMDHVLFIANYLRSGEHTIKYVVKATTTGAFQIPQTKAEEMYAPENYGYKNMPDIKIVESK
ncbi:MAG: hypothetical protein A2Y33_13050 [Spirochaetes bacterium GWF1_51_8]|nr:MAG: hypothetical protein A2Y33_13050 [Spirochaetes bacterium GWF1_51_8]